MKDEDDIPLPPDRSEWIEALSETGLAQEFGIERLMDLLAPERKT